jgi:hypothetical protein
MKCSLKKKNLYPGKSSSRGGSNPPVYAVSAGTWDVPLPNALLCYRIIL